MAALANKHQQDQTTAAEKPSPTFEALLLAELRLEAAAELVSSTTDRHL
jgi:hypothetical protein